MRGAFIISVKHSGVITYDKRDEGGGSDMPAAAQFDFSDDGFGGLDNEVLHTVRLPGVPVDQVFIARFARGGLGVVFVGGEVFCHVYHPMMNHVPARQPRQVKKIKTRRRHVRS